MTREEFIVEMQDILQTEEVLSADTLLTDLVEWDSLAMMAVVAFLDKNFGVDIGLKDFKEINTMADLMTKAGVWDLDVESLGDVLDTLASHFPTSAIFPN